MSDYYDKVLKEIIIIKDPLAVSTIIVVGASLIEKLTKTSLGFENGVINKAKAVTLMTTIYYLNGHFGFL